MASVENNGLDFDAIASKRAAASEAIVNSEADKRLIVAGPGTGKNLHLQAGAFQGDPGLRYHLGDDVALISLAHAESPCLNIA
ncbi:MAG TPA: hypothetical protein VFS69_04085 [Sphingomicrobium sp.]|jgi:hypothetical protein|nr:hypothetical protein [Sphingomicrobium sp.]